MTEFEAATIAYQNASLALPQQGESLRVQGKALETLIERTAPR